MIEVPFSSAIPLKNYLSGIDITFDIDNIKDSLVIAAKDVIEVISEAVYSDLLAKIETDPEDEDDAAKYEEAIQLLRYCLVPLAMYHHFPILQVRVGNNGLTTPKSDNETAAYKYQVDELRENMLLRHGVYLKELIDYIDANADSDKEIFKDWIDSDAQAEQKKLLITSYKEFDKYFRIDGDAGYFMRIREILKDITMQKIEPFTGSISDILAADPPDAVLLAKIKKALAYYTVSQTVFEWDYYYMPAPVRRAAKDIMQANPNSSIKNNPGESDKSYLMARFKNVADGIMRDVENYLAAKKISDAAPLDDVVLPSIEQDASDSYIFMM